MDGRDPTPSGEIAQRIAAVMIEGFDRHYRALPRDERRREAPLRGRPRGRRRSRRCRERIRYYDERVRECVERLTRRARRGLARRRAPGAARSCSTSACSSTTSGPSSPRRSSTRSSRGCCERTYVHNDFAFVRAAVSTEYIESDPPIYRSYYPDERGPAADVRSRSSPTSAGSCPFADLERDVDFVWHALLEHFGGDAGRRPSPNYQVQVLGSAFYRNKAAYVIGKIVNGDDETPFGVPRAPRRRRPARPRHGAVRRRGHLASSSRSRGRTSWSTWTCPSGVHPVPADADAGASRAPSSTPPSGSRSRARRCSSATSSTTCTTPQDVFVEAPGTPGLVMHVFNLPSYPYVLQGDQGRVRALEADRPRDREARSS